MTLGLEGSVRPLPERNRLLNSNPTEKAPHSPVPSASSLDGSAITIAEKLLVQLPREGGVVVLGAVSTSPDAFELARQLAVALRTITARSALLVQTCPPDGNDPGTQGPGLMDVLAGEAPLGQVAVSPDRTGIVHLGYGRDRSDAAERIVSGAFRGFLDAARQGFDWVVLYSPHLLEQRYAASLIARSDLVVAILRKGRDRAVSVREFRDLCGRLGRPFAGVVLAG